MEKKTNIFPENSIYISYLICKSLSLSLSPRKKNYSDFFPYRRRPPPPPPQPKKNLSLPKNRKGLETSIQTQSIKNFTSQIPIGGINIPRNKIQIFGITQYEKSKFNYRG